MTAIQKTIKLMAIGLAIFIIMSIVSTILFVLSIFINIDISTNQQEKQSINISEVYQDINNVEVDLINSNIKIKEGSTWKVEATKVSKNFSVKKENDTLKIKEKENWFNKILNKQNKDGEIIIYVPQGIINDLDIDGGIGKVEIEDVTATELDIDSGVGYIEIENSKFYKTSIDGGFGKIYITSSTLNNLDIDGGVGEIDIEAYITGSSKIECGVGEVDLNLLGNENDYSIFAEKGIGNIQINNKPYSNQSIYNKGVNRIELVGGVGNMRVSFNEVAN